MGRQLTLKQQKFVNEYLIDNNASRAALAAGYSKKTAYAIGNENLKKPEIMVEIEKAIARQAERTEVTADRVIKEYAKVAFVNSRDFIDEDGSTKAIHDLSPNDSAAVQHFEELEDGGTKVRLHDKMKALDSLAKHLGILSPATGDGQDVPSLKVFIQSESGEIRPIGGGDLPEREKTAGVLIESIDGRVPAEE